MSIFKDDILKGRVAVITGGGGDICKEIATVFSAHGAKIVVTSRSQKRLDIAAGQINDATGGEVLAIAADVRKYEELQAVVVKTVEKFGGIDILINGAAGNFPAPIAALSPKGFRTVIEIDLEGTFNMTRACFDELKKAGADHGNASIVNITATLQYVGTPFQAHVNAAKAGIDALTRTVANEWGALNIRCNGVAPGPIDDTEGMRRLSPTAELKEKYKRTIPLRRYGTKREISDACLFLVSDASMYTTGAILVVDGGSWLYSPGLGPNASI